jgi:hypothetical protein
MLQLAMYYHDIPIQSVVSKNLLILAVFFLVPFFQNDMDLLDGDTNMQSEPLSTEQPSSNVIFYLFDLLWPFVGM